MHVVAHRAVQDERLVCGRVVKVVAEAGELPGALCAHELDHFGVVAARVVGPRACNAVLARRGRVLLDRD